MARYGGSWESDQDGNRVARDGHAYAELGHQELRCVRREDVRLPDVRRDVRFQDVRCEGFFVPVHVAIVLDVADEDGVGHDGGVAHVRHEGVLVPVPVPDLADLGTLGNLGRADA
jgi:hypothetical protein